MTARIEQQFLRACRKEQLPPAVMRLAAQVQSDLRIALARRAQPAPEMKTLAIATLDRFEAARSQHLGG